MIGAMLELIYSATFCGVYFADIRGTEIVYEIAGSL